MEDEYIYCEIIPLGKNSIFSDKYFIKTYR